MQDLIDTFRNIYQFRGKFTLQGREAAEIDLLGAVVAVQVQ